MATEASIERPAPSVATLPNAGLALAGLVGTGGMIHLVATIEHIGEEWLLALFFAVVGVAQVAAAWAIYRDPENLRMLKLVAVGSLVVALLWVWSRTIGVPFGPETGRREVGVGDAVATLFELGFAALVGVLLWRGARSVAWLGGGLGVRLTSTILSLGLMLAAFGGHQH
ncbi:MAG: hypothetical protein ACRDMZ_18330 [Solirubrobacteraceae bacterium]